MDIYSQSLSDLIEHIFLTLLKNVCHESRIAERAILATRNERLILLRDLIVNSIFGLAKLFLSAGPVEEAEVNEDQYITDLLNSLAGIASLPDHLPRMKPGFIIMLMRNLQQNTCHVNGTRHFSESMTDNIRFLRVATRSH